MVPFDFHLRTRTIFGGHAADRVGALARESGFRRTLLVADPGIVEAGHAAAVQRSLEAASLAVVPFSDFAENPDSAMVARGAAFAREHGPLDSIVAVGGGSSLDCAKGINFLLTNGGEIGRVPRLRQGHNAAAAVDRHSHDRRHRQRGAELRGDRRCRHAHEDGVRRSVGRVPHRDPRSRAHRQRPAGRFGHGGHRRDRACRRDRRDDAPHAAVRHVLASGVAPARRRLRACRRPPVRHGSPGDDAARRAFRRHRDRAVDARRGARLRQSADRARRPHPRRCARDSPSPRRPLERAGGGRPLRRPARFAPPPRARRRGAARPWPGASRTSPSPAACRPG